MAIKINYNTNRQTIKSLTRGNTFMYYDNLYMLINNVQNYNGQPLNYYTFDVTDSKYWLPVNIEKFTVDEQLYHDVIIYKQPRKVNYTVPKSRFNMRYK